MNMNIYIVHKILNNLLPGFVVKTRNFLQEERDINFNISQRLSQLSPGDQKEHKTRTFTIFTPRYHCCSSMHTISDYL